MPSIELKLDKTSFGSEAYFSGVVEAVGSTGYKFSGTLKVSCPLNRETTNFANTVRIGHGGVSGKYEHLDLDLGEEPVYERTLDVEGEGKRAVNEKVEFYVAVNEGISGQFTESPEVSCDLGLVVDEFTTDSQYLECLARALDAKDNDEADRLLAGKDSGQLRQILAKLKIHRLEWALTENKGMEPSLREELTSYIEELKSKEKLFQSAQGLSDAKLIGGNL